MKPDWWPGEEHEQFTEWAISQGIIANGVGPARFPGRGLGMIATRNIEVCDYSSAISVIICRINVI